MQYKTLEDTVYFWFAANDTSGSGNDGASAVFDVRLAGAAAGAAPVLSGSGTLLSHVDFPAGAYEIAVAATDVNGFAADGVYAVFCTLLVDSQNPSGFVGSFQLAPVIADLTKIHGTALTETPGQLAARFIDFFDQDAAGFNIKTALAAFKATGFAVPGDEMNLEDGAVTNNKLAENCIGGINIGNNAIGNTEIADGAFTESKFAANAITSTVLADAAITAAKIAADAITNAKIADNAIAAENIAANAITAAKIANAAIDFATFAADVITGAGLKANVESITNDAITAAAIATGAIDADAVGATALDNIVISDLATVPGPTAKIVDVLSIMFMALVNECISNSDTGYQTIANSSDAGVFRAAMSEALDIFTREKFEDIP